MGAGHTVKTRGAEAQGGTRGALTDSLAAAQPSHGGHPKTSPQEARASAVCRRVDAASGLVAGHPETMAPMAHELLLSCASSAAGGLEGLQTAGQL